MDKITQDVRLALELAEKNSDRWNRAVIKINPETGVVHLFEYERDLATWKTLVFEGQSFMGIIHA